MAVAKKTNIRKYLPRNDEAEKAVLGMMIRNNGLLADGLAALTSDDFYPENVNHIAIFNALYRLYSRHETVDVQTLINELINANDIEISGGADYISDLIDGGYAFIMFKHYLRIVIDQSLLRHYLLEMDNITQDYYKGDIGDVTSFIGQAEKRLNDIAEKRIVGDFVDAKTAAKNLEKDFEELKEAAKDDSVTGVTTAFTSLNKYTHGWQEGQFIIVAARPGVGKTALALNLALNAAREGASVAYFSLEMLVPELFKRLVANEANINHDNLITGFGLNRKENKIKINEALHNLSQLKIYVDDTAGIQILDLVAKVRSLYNKDPNLKLVFVDHIGLVKTKAKIASESRQAEIQIISQTLKALALELKISIIGLSQLNRKVEERGGEPILSDLRESGSIEQDADVVLMLHEIKPSNKNSKNVLEKNNEEVDRVQDELAKKEGGENTSLINVNLAKNRAGKTNNHIPLLFSKNYCKFSNPSSESEEEIASLNKARIKYSNLD